MNKLTLKQCLIVIDKLEILGYHPDNLKQAVFESVNQRLDLSFEDISLLIDRLIEHGMIRIFDGIIDLAAPITIFARAPLGSISETLGLIESADIKILDELMNSKDRLLDHGGIMKQWDRFPEFCDTVMELKLYERIGQRCRINPLVYRLLSAIRKEKQDQPLISSVTLAYYIHDANHIADLPFRNQSQEVVSYRQQNLIREVLPYQGIPEKRDASENLQSYFKDCLFHEFRHRCAICEINIPPMLIASHIKPFRDCGHLIEAADYRNGILLCRNHDYLFDQGYVSFQNDGTIMISELIHPEDYEKYQLDPTFRLASKHLDGMRRQFLDYHRKHYFKDEKTRAK